MDVNVVAICGSLRKGSYNRKLLRFAQQRCPEGMRIDELDISAFPLFNADFELDPPRPVKDAKALVRPADVLLLVTPEYDYSVPGSLKTAVEWLSRPYGDPTLIGKPLAVMGASTGYMGTIRAQLAWRTMWYYFKAPVFYGSEFTVAFADKAFDEQGRLRDEFYVKQLDDYLVALMEWAEEPARSRATVGVGVG